MKSKIQLYLIKPSSYDDDGYLVRYFRGVLPSNTLACLASLTKAACEQEPLDRFEFKIHEIDEAEREGVRFHFLAAPCKLIADSDGKLAKLEYIRMELGEPDDSGRRRPIPVEGETFDVECDTAIVAIGNAANPLVPSTTKALETNKWGNIVADLETGKTNKDRVWAGGDIVTGAATVILAMGAGRKAALTMLETFGIS